jgi:pimeloyl-ACP methyl ester carboxylesterase
VRALVLFGTFADPAVAFPDRRFSEALLGVVRARWGRGASMVAQLYRPGVGDEGAARLGTILRDSADADVGVGYLAAVYESDATDVECRVTPPALVIHYRDDKVVPFAGGQHLAASLPDARFVALEGGYHLPDVRDVDRLERLVRSFLADVDGR